MHTSHEDIRFLENLKAGNIKAFDTLYRNYRNLLVALAIVILQDKEEAKDLVQELFSNIWQQGLHRDINAASMEELKKFLTVSIRNRCLNKIKTDEVRRKRYESILLSQTVISPQEGMEKVELKQHLNDAIARLSSQQAVIFKKGYLQHKKRKQIAEELQLSEETVKKQMSRALHHLRNILKKAEEL
ncbi:MAG: sigma-70 family RNA polymerase sigma factor [Chitinophagaceae bacterium]|nr:MAG: sigma-70 family RNA polymerase sigma factor [Chitinophagaceae bacterium]